MRSRLSIALLSSLILVAGVLLGTARADDPCSGLINRTTYTVNICITAPAPGASISGDVPISATVIVTGTNPGVDSVVFRLRGTGQGGLGVYTLVDQTGTAPTDAETFGFTLPSYRWPDASRTLIARATMLDGYTTNPGANIGLTFSDPNRTSLWTANTFTPREPTPAADHPDHLVVAAAGDGAIDNQQAANASNEVAALDPDLFLYLGDVYNVGSVAEYYNWYGSLPEPTAAERWPVRARRKAVAIGAASTRSPTLPRACTNTTRRRSRVRRAARPRPDTSTIGACTRAPTPPGTWNATTTATTRGTAPPAGARAGTS